MTKYLNVALLITSVLACRVQAAETIVSDNFGVKGVETGFALNKGINSGIRPPVTRMTGSVAANLRYLQTLDNRPANHFGIDGERLKIREGSKMGRFTLSANGKTPFDFGPALKTDHASKEKKTVYDVTIGMRNDATGRARFSFGLASSESNISQMDFALQLYRAKPSDTFYTVQKRFDRGSYNGATTPGDEGDLNAVMGTTSPGSAGRIVNFLIRVTDAGAEGALDYNSRLQVSLDAGASWIYDTASDPALPNGFRLDGTSRYFVFDQSVNPAGDVWYDNFSVTAISQPGE